MVAAGGTMAPMLPLVVLAVLASQAPDLSGFSALVPDPPPEEITRGSHYWIGNEHRLDLFFPEVKGKGGVHVGVGAEQNWLLCGWSRCQAIVLMDFDQSIVDLQRVYFAAFATAETKEQFMALWLDKKRTGLRAAIKARYQGAEQKGALAALDVARWNVERRFGALKTQLVDKGIPTYFSDDGDYAHVRSVVVGGRAFAVRGDLTANRAMQSIGAAVVKAGLTVQTWYLSNAEQYFSYDKQTRANYLALPLTETTVVLRTHGWNSLRYAKGGNDYHYGIQTGTSLQAFLREPAVTSSRQILQWAPMHGEKGCSLQASTDPMAAKATFEASRPAKPKAKTAPTTSSAATP